MLQQAETLELATPAGKAGERTAPVTSTPVAERRAPQAGMGVLEGVGETLGEVLLLALGVGDAAVGETLGVTETVRVTEGEKEG